MGREFHPPRLGPNVMLPQCGMARMEEPPQSGGEMIAMAMPRNKQHPARYISSAPFEAYTERMVGGLDAYEMPSAKRCINGGQPYKTSDAN